MGNYYQDIYEKTITLEHLSKDTFTINTLDIKTNINKEEYRKTYKGLSKTGKIQYIGKDTLSSKIKDLRIGEEQTIIIVPKKYSFPRIRNLPNRVLCSDETGEIDCIFFKR